MKNGTAFKVIGTNSATQVDTGTHECLIGLLSEAGGHIYPPLLEFKYSFKSDISPAPSEANPQFCSPSPRGASSAMLSSRCRTILQNALFLGAVAACAVWFQVGGTGELILSHSDTPLPPLQGG